MQAKHFYSRLLAAVLIGSLGLPGCSPGREDGGGGGGEERYTSPVVQLQYAAINLEDVQDAFLSSKGADLATWMGAFEQRLNEVYEGEGVVAVDARRQNDKLVVQGFVDQNGEAGKQAADKPLFTLEQTGPASRDAAPMRLADGQGQTWSEGSWGLGASPFLQGFLMASMFSWAGSYFTPRPQMALLANHRNAFRASPAYTRQLQANQGFDARYKARAAVPAQSKRSWGQSRPATNSQPKRTYTQPRSDTWGKRRPSSRRTWGGRRR